MWFLFLIIIVLVPFGILFVLLRRYEKERFWRWFLLYVVCGTVGGFLAFILADAVSDPFGPIWEAYITSAVKLLNRAGLHSLVPLFVRLHPVFIGAMLWYLGIGFATWVVWREHASRRRIRAERSGAVQT